ncbi:hypothetical protein DCS_08072 [Drechmeria coniospora]|uniref:Neutral protease 2 n=1 Tax=Drechmeria coniospora TaxID=98403 RepID=A0A151GGB6_DRECN|nr:hypothetical protein DCS_08072 [Drechmeria coniospora]KYK56106.1 hypothetical protein DCS_08072 [Drechmeria coniospora]
MDNLGDAAFQPVAAGQSVHVEFDIAEAHDLSAGGTISIHTQGRIPFAWEGQKAIAGSLPYSSNTVETVINDTLAAPALLSRRLNKNEIRAEVSGCEGDKLEAIEKAVSNCRSYAAIALHAIKSGPSERIEEYFMDSSESTRETVAGVYERVHEQCSSLNSGAPASCADLFDHCEVSGALAYTHTGKTMIYCDKFFTMPPVPRKCRKKSQATTFLHETTHLQIVNRNRDLAYGYNNLRELTHEEAIKNADTYALFASASEMDCDIPSSRLDEGAEDDE